MGWDNFTLNQFASAVPFGEFDESEYYGPYNTLLNDLFPKEKSFMVVPQFKRPESDRAVDFTTIFLVRYKKHAVFFVEVKPAGHLRHNSSRISADKQIRERMDYLIADSAVRCLHGVSAIGTKVCFYRFDYATGIVPPEPTTTGNKKVVPKELWSLDILSPEGEEKMRDVAKEVESLCSEIDNDVNTLC